MEPAERAAPSLIQTPAQVMSMNPRADRSWRIAFETPELSGENVKLLADNFQGEGWLLFKPNSQGVDLGEVPIVDADAGIESPSVRLRKRMYAYWRQNQVKGSFEAFYFANMQKYIATWESKLEETNGNI